MNHKHGNKEGWLDGHGDYLYRYAMSKVYNRDDAFDLVQETLIAAWKADYRGDSSIRTWMMGIMKHKVVDHIRKNIRIRKLNAELEHGSHSEFFDESGGWLTHFSPLAIDPERMIQDSTLHNHLMESISSLQEPQRTIFVLRELNGESTQSICDTYEISRTNLHVIMHRVRLTLCKKLEALGYAKKDHAMGIKLDLQHG